MLGKTFLRLERDFDKHIKYCRDVPLAHEFLANNPQATEFFEVSFASVSSTILFLSNIPITF